MTESIPRTVQRPMNFENGQAIGISNRWEKGQYCSILTAAGIVGCGIYDLETPAEFEVPLDVAHEAHGGGDPRMLDALFGPVDPGEPAQGAAAHPPATQRDGALALAVGLAANRCCETGRPVAVRDLVPGVWES